MTKDLARKLVDVGMGRLEADLCIANAEVVDVYNRTTFLTDVYIIDGFIAAFKGKVRARETIDAKGRYFVPGLIDAHCHIESSHLSPSAFSDAVVPYGTTTVIADPHEICNVAGLDALDYMLKASENIPLSVFYMFPSCVPATPFENAGAVLLARDIEKRIDNPRILGLGEMMNYPGIVYGDEQVYDKLESAYKRKKNIDGHSPAIEGNVLDAYTACRITTDHECATPEELRERVRRGMYVMLRQGTACKNVTTLVKGVDEGNSSRVLFCTDDRQPQSIEREGHINYGVNLAIKEGLSPLMAISMATLNAATCYGLSDRGAIAPGLRADFFLTEKLDDLQPEEVFILGKAVARGGKIIRKAPHTVPEKVSGMMDVKDFSAERLKLKLSSDRVNCIDIIPGGVVTGRSIRCVKRDSEGCFVHDPGVDLLKLAVIERHHGTGNIGLALISGYGMTDGAVATSIAHDSHNIIVIGSDDEDMAVAVNELIRLGGGITMVKDSKVLMSHRLEIAGLMTDESEEEVVRTLDEMHEVAEAELRVSPEIDPFMTLCFMALPVIPELKLTDTGLFDVTAFKHIPNEAE